jgi:outer membrane protein OmpA-like peptidoglycan-associated protein
VKELVAEKKPERMKASSSPKSKPAESHTYEMGYVGLAYHPPEKFAPLPAKLSRPEDAARRAQILIKMQQTYGNRYVQKMLQAKIKVGQLGDRYEQEANRVAKQVMRMPELLVQKQPEEEEEEEETIQTKPEDYARLQRQAEEEEEEEEPIQTKENSSSTAEVKPGIESSINSLKGGGQPLPRSVRNYFEPRFGYDFSGVRVHTDRKASETAKSINAKAFTKGKNIVFGGGQYSPETSGGKSLLAHELTHVIQQNIIALEKQKGLQRKINEGREEARSGRFTPRLSLFPSDIPKPIVMKTKGGILATVYFGKDSSFLFDENLKMVEDISNELIFRSNPTIIIDGHASTEGGKIYNQRLSEMRRMAVISILLSKPRLVGKKLGCAGKAYGEAKPVIKEIGKTEKEKERKRTFNRRVEIIILGLATEEPKSPPKESESTVPKEPIKLKDLFPPVEYKPETLEEKLKRIIKEIPPAAPKKRSLSELIWKKVDEKMEDALRKVGVPPKYRESIKKLLRKGIEKGVEKIFDKVMEEFDVPKSEREMIKRIIEGGTKVPLL